MILWISTSQITTNYKHESPGIQQSYGMYNIMFIDKLLKVSKWFDFYMHSQKKKAAHVFTKRMLKIVTAAVLFLFKNSSNKMETIYFSIKEEQLNILVYMQWNNSRTRQWIQ
jgi:hypothetical protein